MTNPMSDERLAEIGNHRDYLEFVCTADFECATAEASLGCIDDLRADAKRLRELVVVHICERNESRREVERLRKANVCCVCSAEMGFCCIQESERND